MTDQEQTTVATEPTAEAYLKKAFAAFKRNPTKANAQALGKTMVEYAKEYSKQY